MQIAEPRVSLKLEGRRLDADSFILSANGQDFKSRFREWSVPKFVVPVDLDLKIDSIGLGQEDLSNAIARLSLDRGQAKIDLFEFTAPGETRVALEGKAGLGTREGRRARSPCNPSNRIVSPAISTGSICARRSFVFSTAGRSKRLRMLPSCPVSRSTGCG